MESIYNHSIHDFSSIKTEKCFYQVIDVPEPNFIHILRVGVDAVVYYIDIDCTSFEAYLFRNRVLLELDYSGTRESPIIGSRPISYSTWWDMTRKEVIADWFLNYLTSMSNPAQYKLIERHDKDMPKDW